MIVVPCWALAGVCVALGVLVVLLLRALGASSARVIELEGKLASVRYVTVDDLRRQWRELDGDGDDEPASRPRKGD